MIRNIKRNVKKEVIIKGDKGGGGAGKKEKKVGERAKRRKGISPLSLF